jgi:hypothetical protein
VTSPPLIVGPVNDPVPFLPLADGLPSVDEPLEIVGHPEGNLYVGVQACLTSTGYRKSGTLLVAGQQPIFRIADVDLIYFTTTLNKGTSGVPVVSSGRAIGVLSGSRETFR